MTTWSNLNFQNANSPIMEQLVMFHDNTMMIILMITILVGYNMSLIIYLIQNSQHNITIVQCLNK